MVQHIERAENLPALDLIVQITGKTQRPAQKKPTGCIPWASGGRNKPSEMVLWTRVKKHRAYKSNSSAVTGLAA